MLVGYRVVIEASTTNSWRTHPDCTDRHIICLFLPISYCVFFDEENYIDIFETQQFLSWCLWTHEVNWNWSAYRPEKRRFCRPVNDDYIIGREHLLMHENLSWGSRPIGTALVPGWQHRNDTNDITSINRNKNDQQVISVVSRYYTRTYSHY